MLSQRSRPQVVTLYQIWLSIRGSCEWRHSVDFGSYADTTIVVAAYLGRHLGRWPYNALFLSAHWGIARSETALPVRRISPTINHVTLYPRAFSPRHWGCNGHESMNRTLRSICRPSAAFRLPLSSHSHQLGHRIAMAHLSTNAMAHASAINGQSNTWQGAGAAEFDLRSKVALLFDMVSH